MANEVKFEITGGEQFAKLSAGFEPEVKAALLDALEATLAQGKKIVQDTIQEAKAVATGTLLKSVTSRIDSLSSAGWNAVGDITFLPPADEYASFADGGRGPRKNEGQSNLLEQIIAWVEVKGIDRNLAYPIARSINARGTNVAGWSRFGRTAFIQTATARVDAEAQKQFDKIADKIQKRLDADANNNSGRT